ncbi:MAG TPA: ABC transporter permease [Desulfosporosinus sp.]|nr:ABC transporter permease [Desulfosporosinus sp.]
MEQAESGTVLSQPEEKAGKARISSRLQILLGRILTGIVIFGLWQGLSGPVFKSTWVSRPSLIYTRLAKMTMDGSLWFHLSITLQEMLIGLVIGMIVGTVLGILMATSGKVQHYFSPYIMALSSLPRAALAPLFVVWFGIGLNSKISVVVMMVVFLAYYNAYEGIRNLDSDLTQMMNSFKATRLQKLRWHTLPSIAPWMMNSIRLGIGTSTIGAVIAEMVGANRGIGYYISYSSALIDTTGVFAGLVVIMIVAVFLDQVIVFSEKQIFKYRSVNG